MSIEITEQPASAAVTEAKPGSLHPVVRRSRIYLAAWMAAEKALPPESLRLIEEHDALHAAYRKAGWPSPTPQPLRDAAKQIEADPLASIAFDLRRKCNMEAHEEWRAENPANDKAQARRAEQ